MNQKHAQATPSAREQSADPDAWVDQHADVLFRYAVQRLRDPDRAEELVQETFLAAIRQKDTFTGRSTVRTWLVGILKNKIVDHLRLVSRARAREEGVSAEASSEGAFTGRGTWKHKPAAWRLAESVVLEDEEFRRAFEHCLGGLPDHIAHAFWLREVDELSADEVCEVLGVTSTNLWTKLYRARMMLRECLEHSWFKKS